MKARITACRPFPYSVSSLQQLDKLGCIHISPSALHPFMFLALSDPFHLSLVGTLQNFSNLDELKESSHKRQRTVGETHVGTEGNWFDLK